MLIYLLILIYIFGGTRFTSIFLPEIFTLLIVLFLQAHN